MSNINDEKDARRQVVPSRSDSRPDPESPYLEVTSRPYRSGYEIYKKPGSIPNLEVDQSLWTSHAVPSNGIRSDMLPSRALNPDASRKKMMSLEEVEASMQPKPKKWDVLMQRGTEDQALNKSSLAATKIREHELSLPLQAIQGQRSSKLDTGQRGYLQDLDSVHFFSDQDKDASAFHTSVRGPRAHINHDRSAASGNVSIQTLGPGLTSEQTTRVPEQNLSRVREDQVGSAGTNVTSHVRLPKARSALPVTVMGEQQVHLPIISHPVQMANLTVDQRQTLVADEAKRARRNHKIYLLSKGNGLMTPQDKNFITRIQLQQLMTATSTVQDEDTTSSLSEDFYYQVYNQIEGRYQRRSQQPFASFAQTYLYQTGRRHGTTSKRQFRGDNHVHRMQQQVQRAVEAAKAKPKNKQLVIEGSLGKISFSNAKTPKPLLNVRRNEAKHVAPLNFADRKVVLKDIEAVYTSLMAIEDHDRRVPQHADVQTNPQYEEQHRAWQGTFQGLSRNLWSSLKVMEPIIPESTVMHPFIAFLSYPKGKKAMPRIHPHINQEQRLTILTIIIVQLDTLDVVQTQRRSTDPESRSEDQTDLFLQMVMPSLFSYVTGAPLSVVIGLVGLVIERVNVSLVASSRIGLEILTMLLSQAEIIRKSEVSNEEEWEQWLGIYYRLFDIIEPLLSSLLLDSTRGNQDAHVWQFLATLGTGANPEQQQRLVLAVK